MDLKWLAAQVALGKTDKEIAEASGLPVHTVAYHRRAALGLVRHPEGRRKWEVDAETLSALVADGKNDRAIAEHLGMTISGVRQYRKRFGIARPGDAEHKGRQFWAGRRGEHAANWRGGKMRTGNGYIRIFKPDHPHANRAGYVYEHRFVMEETLGRLLDPKEIVDHIDRNRSNNAPDNLRLHENRSQHVKDHFSARDQLIKAEAKLARYEALYGPLPDEP